MRSGFRRPLFADTLAGRAFAADASANPPGAFGARKIQSFFCLELIKRAFGVVVLLAVASFGVTALAYGMVVASIIAFLINSYYTKHFISYGPFDQMRDVASALGMASVMAGVVLGIRRLLG